MLLFRRYFSPCMSMEKLFSRNGVERMHPHTSGLLFVRWYCFRVCFNSPSIPFCFASGHWCFSLSFFQQLHPSSFTPFCPLLIFFGFVVNGSFSGSVAAASTTPFDVIRTRLQVQQSGPQRLYLHPADALVKIVASEGVLGLFQGISARVLWLAPTTAITIVVCMSLAPRYDIWNRSLFLLLILSLSLFIVFLWCLTVIYRRSCAQYVGARTSRRRSYIDDLVSSLYDYKKKRKRNIFIFFYCTILPPLHTLVSPNFSNKDLSTWRK